MCFQTLSKSIDPGSVYARITRLSLVAGMENAVLNDSDGSEFILVFLHFSRFPKNVYKSVLFKPGALGLQGHTLTLQSPLAPATVKINVA